MNAQQPLPPREEAEDDTLGTFVALLEELRDLEGHDRRDALAEWVRSAWWTPCGMILEGWQGELHREAYRCLSADLEADIPGRRWNQADYSAGRDTIARLLGAEGFKHRLYATLPFRLIWTQEDEPWIGGAIGCPPALDAEKYGAWEHIDIRHVILWNPKTNQTRLLGDEEQPSHLVMPEPVPPELEVFSDTRAFFSAWARQRAAYAGMAQLHQLPESRDGHLPGALVVGSIEKVRFPIHAADTLVARRPLSRAALRNAVLRSANLPKIEEASVAHG